MIAARAVASRFEERGAVNEKQDAGARKNKRQQGEPDFGCLRWAVPRRLIDASMHQRRCAGTYEQHNANSSPGEITHERSCLWTSCHHRG